MATFGYYGSFINEDDEKEKTSTDDLEKELVLVAANADRNQDVNVEQEEEETNEVTTNFEKKDCYEPSAKDRKRKHEGCEENVQAKYQKNNLGESMPQTSEGYANIVATHYNSLEEKGLHERSKSRIFYMRNFHNWIKSMLINEYLVKVKEKKRHNGCVRVLDMCCGKGGDLLKWRKGNISHLICCDIASVSLEQCKSRYSDMQKRSLKERGSGNIYSIEYIVADCTRVRLREKYKDPSMKLDVVSCQFAFHYSFESIKQAECMLRNAAECLQPGGYFIGTIPDANDLVARAQKANSNCFGNDVYQVQFDCDINKPPLFGAKYNFHLDGVVDCPEFLVHFPTLVKLAKKYGLKLLKKEKFYEFYEKIKGEGRQLITNMKGLETYPPHPGSSLVGTAKDDYEAAKDYIKNNVKDSNVRIGTLSKSEWDASSLYLVFAFEKVKNTWAADGTPVYDI